MTSWRTYQYLCLSCGTSIHRIRAKGKGTAESPCPVLHVHWGNLLFQLSSLPIDADLVHSAPGSVCTLVRCARTAELICVPPLIQPTLHIQGVLPKRDLGLLSLPTKTLKWVLIFSQTHSMASPSWPVLSPPFQVLPLGFTLAVLQPNHHALSYIPLLRLSWLPAMSSPPYIPRSRVASSLLPSSQLETSLDSQPVALKLLPHLVYSQCVLSPTPIRPGALSGQSHPVSLQHRGHPGNMGNHLPGLES